LRELGDICEIARGGSPRPIQEFITNAPSGVNWIKISDATASGKYIYSTKEKITQAGVQRSRMVNEGDFILSNSMSFGRPYIMKTSGCIHDGWLVLSDKKHVFDQDYLYYFLGSDIAYRQFDSLAAGSTVRNLNIESAKKVKVPLPPIAEQKRIAAILDEAFAGIAAATANAEKNLANARELFEGFLNSALSQRTTSWIDLRFSEFATISYGYTEKATFEEIGPKFLRITDIQEDGVDWDTVPTCPIGDADFKRHRLLDGDIVFARTGATTGKSYIIATPPPAVAASYLIRCRLNKSYMLPSYVALYFQSDQYWEHVARGTTGSAQGGFNASKLAGLVIPIPTFSEQKKLVEKFDYLKTEIGRLETIYRQKLDALIDLKQAILQKAFSGELTGAKNRHSEAA
ncbi:MAG TPA: restriction endonuclease subunit S, partial [Acidiphilium sp.]|nr:restriction endonuclease subunit S [Acidiphilium sp.]